MAKSTIKTDITPLPVNPQSGLPWRTIFIILTVISGILLAVTTAFYWLQRSQQQESALEDATRQTIEAAQQLDEDFADSAMLTEQIAQDLSDGTLAYEDIASRLQEVLEENLDLAGITVAFDHGAFSPEYDLYFIYVSRDQLGSVTVEALESRYDYTRPPSDDPEAPATAWFYNPFNEGPKWTEPFLAAGAGRYLIEYGYPFASPSGGEEPIGVVAVDYSLNGMRELVASLDLGMTGFGAVYSDSGTFLSHPVPERIVEGNIFSEESLQDEGFQEGARRALAGEAFSSQRVVNEERVWNFFAPIVGTGWALVSQLSAVEFRLGGRDLLRSQVAIVLSGGTFLFFLTAVLLHFEEGSRYRLWLTSISFSVIGLAMIVITIILARHAPKDLTEGLMLTSETVLRRYTDTLAREYDDRGLSPLVEIPTGILIQSARFPEPSVVTINGYVWQRVPIVEGKEVSPGVTFPQLIDEPFMIEEVYREPRQDETLIIWNVNAALRQTLDPIQYPLDRYDINLRLAPQDFSSNALLVPDLSAYNVAAPSQLPGLDDTVRINSWRILASAFGLDFRRFGTDLGLPQRPTVDIPELAFNLRVERRFLGPFIAFFLPALVAAIMIFGYLMNDIKPDEPEEIITALTYTAALFFVIAVLHSTLRDNAAAIGLTYLEYFYLLLYVLTLLVAANAFLLVKYPYLPMIRLGDNLVAKLLFWPIVVSFMLLVTLYVFV